MGGGEFSQSCPKVSSGAGAARVFSHVAVRHCVPTICSSQCCLQDVRATAKLSAVNFAGVNGSILACQDCSVMLVYCWKKRTVGKNENPEKNENPQFRKTENPEKPKSKLGNPEKSREIRKN